MELCGREIADEFLPEMTDFHVAFRNLIHTVNLRHGTDGFTSPPKEGVLRIFSAGFELANLDTKGQHATSRPPKPLTYTLSCVIDCNTLPIMTIFVFSTVRTFDITSYINCLYIQGLS